MAKSKKNEDKPKLNLTVRDEQCQSKNGVVKILSFSFWQAFCSAIHLATMRDRDLRRYRCSPRTPLLVGISLASPGSCPIPLAAQTEANAVGKDCTPAAILRCISPRSEQSFSFASSVWPRSGSSLRQNAVRVKTLYRNL
jgi:hypothetical protein